jgi:hypothetical protein
MSIFGDRYIAVGTTDHQQDRQDGVVVCIKEMGNIVLNEAGTRKLADDLLRNANYLWPIKEQSNETT